jgi:hypothetical protein
VSLADEVTPRLGDVAGVMARAIHTASATLTEDLVPETESMCLANISLVVAMLRDGANPEGVQPPAEALRYSRELVHRGLPVESLLGAYRVGHGAFWRIWLEHMRTRIESREVLAEAVAYCSAWTFGYVDAVSGPLATAFGEEKEGWARSAAAQRADEIKAILEGRNIDEQSTSQRLRYELARRHVAYILWVDDMSDASSAEVALEELASSVGRALGCSSPLVLSTARGAATGWASVPPGDVDPVESTKALAAVLAKGRARLVFGEPGQGIDGFRRSYEEALTARRVAALAHRPTGARIRFDDVALTALLTSDLPEAHRYVLRELGPLAADTDAMRRLVATLRVYLEEGGSFVRAARRLSVHENTVTYRVKRAVELLGRPVDEGVLRIHVALMLCEVLRRAEERDQ